MTDTFRMTEERLRSLEDHLRRESPLLVDVVQSFRQLDAVAQGIGLLPKSSSFAMQVSWWPMVSFLGTYSAGKSAFVNYYLGHPLQRSGNQAVDDRFTVICYGGEERTLPGVALDSDLRFPFFRISDEIESVAKGEGKRIDSYLQLKTCPSEKLLGRIVIDSPGFDADSQRTSTLKITDQIIDLSDLVLVFFDARHPEPGAMRDTLEHLVAKTVRRSDAAKFLYVLNQIDTAAKEDNSEEVVAAWQRALAEYGLTAGRFFVMFNPEAAPTIEDPAKRERYEARRDADLGEVMQRIQEVGVSRAYRIVGALEKIGDHISDHAVPKLQAARKRWRSRVIWTDLILFLAVVGIAVAIAANVSTLEAVWERLKTDRAIQIATGAGFFILFATIHIFVRDFHARLIARRLRSEESAAGGGEMRGDLAAGFRHGTRTWRPMFAPAPGCGKGALRRLSELQGRAARHVQTLNDNYTNPSGALAEAGDGGAG